MGISGVETRTSVIYLVPCFSTLNSSRHIGFSRIRQPFCFLQHTLPLSILSLTVRPPIFWTYPQRSTDNDLYNYVYLCVLH